jgi:hypothetical protein
MLEKLDIDVYVARTRIPLRVPRNITPTEIIKYLVDGGKANINASSAKKIYIDILPTASLENIFNQKINLHIEEVNNTSLIEDRDE